MHTFDFLPTDTHSVGIPSSWKVLMILDGLFQVGLLFVELTQFLAERVNHFILSVLWGFEHTLNNSVSH